MKNKYFLTYHHRGVSVIKSGEFFNSILDAKNCESIKSWEVVDVCDGENKIVATKVANENKWRDFN